MPTCNRDSDSRISTGKEDPATDDQNYNIDWKDTTEVRAPVLIGTLYILHGLSLSPKGPRGGGFIKMYVKLTLK